MNETMKSQSTVKRLLFATSVVMNVALLIMVLHFQTRQIPVRLETERRVRQEVRFKVMRDLFTIAREKGSVVLPGGEIMQIVNRATEYQSLQVYLNSGDQGPTGESAEWLEWLQKQEP
jgi:hypothetical protein